MKKSNDLKTLVPGKLVDQWALIAIERFQKALIKKGIGVTGQLFNSFKRQLILSGGDVSAVIIKFLMYGRFRDMGVGNGLKAYERKTNRANLIAVKRFGSDLSYVSRQPKKWYNKVRITETMKLKEILVQEMGDEISTWIAKEFSDEITLGI